MPALLSKPAFRFGRQASGRCPCGRKALVLARCIQCAKADLELEAEPGDEDEEPDAAEVAALDAEISSVVRQVTPLTLAVWAEEVPPSQAPVSLDG